MLQQLTPRLSRDDGTYAVVLAPTKELAAQLFDEAWRVCAARFRWIVPGILSGGRKKKAEKATLRKGVTLLVATPGRLLDHLRTTEAFRSAHLRWIVLDEADRLLDHGFEHDLSEIVSLLRERASALPAGQRVQTIMTSATLHASMRAVAERVVRMHEPLFVDADLEERRASSKKPSSGKTDEANGTAELDDALLLSMPSQLQQCVPRVVGVRSRRRAGQALPGGAVQTAPGGVAGLSTPGGGVDVRSAAAHACSLASHAATTAPLCLSATFAPSSFCTS